MDVLDGNALAKGRDYFQFGGIDLSPDQTLLAWSFDGNGAEFFELKVRDTAKGQDLADILANTAGDAAWATDGKSLFYTLQDENHRPLKIFHHRLGEDPQAAHGVEHHQHDHRNLADHSRAAGAELAHRDDIQTFVDFIDADEKRS